MNKLANPFFLARFDSNRGEQWEPFLSLLLEKTNWLA